MRKRYNARAGYCDISLQTIDIIPKYLLFHAAIKYFFYNSDKFLSNSLNFI